MKILLVEPSFPLSAKSRNHKDFLPIGLLKIGAMYQAKGHEVKLIRGESTKKAILKIGNGNWHKPDIIMITSLFTYWKEHVVKSVEHYRKLYPLVKIVVGGIYASLMKNDCEKINGVDKVWVGIHPEAEKYKPAYHLIEQNPHPLDYQILHTSRGCTRKCDFCGTWKIEPNFNSKSSIKDNIFKRKLVFYDNNLLMNPNIENILNELIELKKSGKIRWCESQSGFDGRIIEEKPYLAHLLKRAGFKNTRIAWDGHFREYNRIKKQLDIMADAGYNYKDIYVFVLYNWKIAFEEMELKRIKCWGWNVQVADCRFRPLDMVFDKYNPSKKQQSSQEYYIHETWNDSLIRQFRKNVRRHNICVRQNLKFYSKMFERKKADKEIIQKTKIVSRNELEKLLTKKNIDFWFPEKITYPD